MRKFPRNTHFSIEKIFFNFLSTFEKKIVLFFSFFSLPRYVLLLGDMLFESEENDDIFLVTKEIEAVVARLNHEKKKVDNLRNVRRKK